MKHSKKEFLKKISKKQDLEVALPQYANYLTSAYNSYALIQVAFNYMSCYDSYIQTGYKNIKEIDVVLKELNDIIKATFTEEVSGVEREKLISRINSLRNEVIKQMKVLTTYTDTLQIYEYILVKKKYILEYDGNPVDIEKGIQRIFKYIFEDINNNALVNERIKAVIGQLPVRMTKSRFNEMILNSLKLYKGSDKASLKGFVYILRMASMLEKPEGMNEYFSVLEDFLNKLNNINYNEVEIEECSEILDEIDNIAEYISSVVDLFLEIENVINSLYSTLLASTYILETRKSDDSSIKLIKIVNEAFLDGKYEELNEDKIMNYIGDLEGKQEDIYEKYAPVEMILREILTSYKDLIASLMLENQFNVLSIIEKLLSSSVFIELDVNEEDTEIVDDEFIQKVSNDFADELAEKFKSQDKEINRAIQSLIISNLPVFFKNQKEIKEYIEFSLEQCKNVSEVRASLMMAFDEIEEDE